VTRGKDSNSWRYGGEEFLVGLNKCDPGSALARAENLRNVIGSRPIAAAGNSLAVTISAGLALSSEFAGSDLEEIIHQAEMALYAAKAAGGNCVRLGRPKRE
jgi:diguanylate cyclase (GGDEF)-like protein